MSIVAGLVGRNLRLFFRDRLGVLFSLLSGLILFCLYTFFLSRLQVAGLSSTFPTASRGAIGAFVDSWMLSGIVLLTTLTAGVGALSTLVDDRATGRFADFLVAPVRRTHLVLGYLLSAVVVSVVMSTVLLVLTVVYLGLTRGVWLSAASVLAALGVLVLCSAAFTSLGAFAASFLRTPGAYSAFATITGTVIGFVAGAYIPVGSLPSGVASGINALPFAQGAMLMRRPFTRETLAALTGGDPGATAQMRTFYGIDISVGSSPVPVAVAVVVLLVTVAGFAALSAGRIRRVLR